jgi:hypothetical protein
LRAVRFSFFRSSLSSIFVVSATYNLFRCNLLKDSRKPARSSAGKATGSILHGNREFTCGQCEVFGEPTPSPLHSEPKIFRFQGTMINRPEILTSLCSASALLLLRTSSAPHAPITALTGVRYAFQPDSPRARAGNEPF